jgi:hypothetical protein
MRTRTYVKAVASAILVSVLSGCSAINATVFKPANEYSRVDPLFKSQECHDAPNAWQVFVRWFSDACANQELAIDFSVAGDKDSNGLSLAVCKGLLASTPVPTADGTQKLEVPAPASSASQGDHPLGACAAYLITKSDQICDIHKSYIYSNRTVTNLSLGLLSSGTGIAGGLVPGLGAANVLSGTSGFLTGARALGNEEIYHNYLAEAVIKEIEARRNEERERLKVTYLGATPAKDKLIQVQGVTEPAQLLMDVQDYHQQCSFYVGLSHLLDKAGKTVASDPREAIKQKIVELKSKQTGANTNQRLEDEIKTWENVLLTLNVTYGGAPVGTETSQDAGATPNAAKATTNSTSENKKKTTKQGAKTR